MKYQEIHELVAIVNQLQAEDIELPFAVYRSVREQHIINVPIVKPTLICVLDGYKTIHQQDEIRCSSGSFLFLANSSETEIRNIPRNANYLALIIEFEFDDFSQLETSSATHSSVLTGEMSPMFIKSLSQFVEWSAYAPQSLWGSRRAELLHVLQLQGAQIASVIQAPSLSHRLYELVKGNLDSEINAEVLADKLAMSSSSLHRKLKAENVSLQTIKDDARLGSALHLLQTSFQPIGRISEQCGYQSQSRFTDKFKQKFGMTPTALRKSRLPE